MIGDKISEKTEWRITGRYDVIMWKLCKYRIRLRNYSYCRGVKLDANGEALYEDFDGGITIETDAEDVTVVTYDNNA